MDVLQHHMPSLCALSLQTNSNAVTHTFSVATHTFCSFKKLVATQWKGWLRQTLKQHPGINTHTFKLNSYHISTVAVQLSPIILQVSPVFT